VPADLVLEVELAAVPVAAEDDHVARALEGVEALQLPRQQRGVVVVGGEELPRGGVAQRQPVAAVHQQGAAEAVAQEHEGDPLQAGDGVGKARLEAVHLVGAEAARAVGEVEVGQAARVGQCDAPFHRLALRTVTAALVLGDVVAR